MTELICIGCPRGCHLTVWEENDFAVKGAGCEKGLAYGLEELQNPTRILTSTVRIIKAEIPRLPVKTDAPLPKHLMREAMALLDEICLTAPVKRGQMVANNVLGTGVNFVATRSLGVFTP